MKFQVLNSPFGKVLAAAAAIAFMISLTSPAQAQQGQWGADSYGSRQTVPPAATVVKNGAQSVEHSADWLRAFTEADGPSRSQSLYPHPPELACLPTAVQEI